MICLICRQAEIIDGFSIVAFERGEFKWIAKGVPARVCPNCGEAFIEESIAVRLLDIATKGYESGRLDTKSEFSTL